MEIIKEMTKDIKSNFQDEDMKTIIADDVTINGDLTTEKDVVVYGNYFGTLTCQTLCVEATGSVKGDIDAETIKVSGRLDGKVTANNLMVSKTGGVEGEYECINFGIEPGATIKASKLNCLDAVEQQVRNPSASVRRHPRVVVSGASDMPMDTLSSSRQEINGKSGSLVNATAPSTPKAMSNTPS